jgi:hypothetical protein
MQQQHLRLRDMQVDCNSDQPVAISCWSLRPATRGAAAAVKLE